MKLEPDCVDRVYARAADVIPVALVDSADPFREPSNVVLISRDDWNQFAERFAQTLDDFQDPSLRLLVLLVLLPIADRLDELVVETLEAAVPSF